MDLQLVILAAGLGSRYGGSGLKQLEAVGPGGATLMEYSLYDARRAGFGEAVFVIRAEMADGFRDFAAARFGSRVPWRTAVQRLEDVPPGVAVPHDRAKPWGTAQALLAAADLVSGPCAVLNADDFYGAEAFSALATFFHDHAADRPPSHAVIGYRLRDSVPDGGAVNRGAARADAAGWLETIEEVTGLVRAGDDRYVGRSERTEVRLSGDALVSMNLWGFSPAIFDTLRRGWREFFRQGAPGTREYLLPTVVREAIGRGECRVKLLEAGSRWFGITHAADRAVVSEALRDLVAKGRYPERLWA
jgi:nucleotidyltransferase-like protein